LLLTTDRRIRYQPNLQVRGIALVVLTVSTKWSRVRQHADPDLPEFFSPVVTGKWR
jgi:hypothetical protein